MDESVLARGDTVPPGTVPSRGTPPDPHGPDRDGPEPSELTSGFRLAWRRSPWLVPGGLLLILALLTVNVLADGPLAGADRRIRAVVRAHATSGAWQWLSDSWHAPARLLVDLGNYEVAVPVLAACALIAAAPHPTLPPP